MCIRDRAHVVPGRRQKQNGHRGELANFGAPVKPVVKGQGDVQQHKLGIVGGKFPGNMGKMCIRDRVSPKAGALPTAQHPVFYFPGNVRSFLKACLASAYT